MLVPLWHEKGDEKRNSCPEYGFIELPYTLKAFSTDARHFSYLRLIDLSQLILKVANFTPFIYISYCRETQIAEKETANPLENVRKCETLLAKISAADIDIIR